MEEVWGLLLLVVRGLMLLKLELVVGLVRLVVRRLVLGGSWVVKDFLFSLLSMMDGVGRRMGR